MMTLLDPLRHHSDRIHCNQKDMSSEPTTNEHSPTTDVSAARPVRSDFDLEPNPFEQSFSAPPASNVRSRRNNDSNNGSTVPSPPREPASNEADRPHSSNS